MKHLILFFSLLMLWADLNAQISGKITDSEGEPLSFASVYVKGTSIGTTSNVNGEYRLELQSGNYNLVFQYVGFKQVIAQIRIKNDPILLDVTLQEQPVELGEVVVKANAEDPAYAVIRKAIEKRKYFRDLIKAYSCDVYIKGNIKFLDAPEKFFGRDLGDLGGTLDSNRQGIVYLSESQSKLYFQEPDEYKEEMLSSKVSGNDNGFGFNRASDMDFNLYENTADFSRQIVSPIAGNALAYYRYRLIGTFLDDEGRLVNKIEVIPRRNEDPVYRGIIYITEDIWNIQSADLLLLQANINQPGLDSLSIKQVYVPIQQPDMYRIFSQAITFRAGLFGFRLGGTFTGIYSNYNLEPNFASNFFGNEVFKVNDGANEKPLEFWDTIRPIPLTEEETVDYVRKDSLQEIRESKPYLDSIDAKNNKFKPIDILFGYDYRNSYERRYLNINSPATTVQFNTVQGWNADLNATYRREFDENSTRWWSARGSVNYGFADKRLRGTLGLNYRFEQKHSTQIGLSGGINATQFNGANPISKTLNTLYSLIGKENYMKLYDKAFGRINFQREFFNGVFLTTALEYAQRTPLVNRTDFSWNKNKEKSYEPNDPLGSEFVPSFEQSEALTFTANLRLRYKQKYISYPDRKFNYGSDLPDLWIQYRKGIRSFGSDVNYDLLSVRILENDLSLGVVGTSEFQVEAGKFLTHNSLQFMDFRHFLGNQTFIGSPDRYASSFFLLPYYEHSTNDSYLQVHFQHNFDGWILGKIPLIRKLGWREIFKAGFLYTKEKKDYLELGVGLDNIGFGVFRLFRFDLVWSHNSAGKWDIGYMIGIQMPIDED
ncbi:MAG: DUF5686 and carboxypeptidase regulatory-like domain-containing protein [Saprospiraceae bacterium]|nr:DUF5686 and carboxypeptidase regulatory-like domain-containing protein [Saprospiraceae bacterium]